MFLINSEQKPDTAYKVILTTAIDDTVEASVKKALEKLEVEINTFGADDILSNKKRLVTLIGSANITVTTKEKHNYCIATASQTVLVKQY